VHKQTKSTKQPKTPLQLKKANKKLTKEWQHPKEYYIYIRKTTQKKWQSAVGPKGREKQNTKNTKTKNNYEHIHNSTKLNKHIQNTHANSKTPQNEIQQKMNNKKMETQNKNSKNIKHKIYIYIYIYIYQKRKQNKQ